MERGVQSWEPSTNAINQREPPKPHSEARIDQFQVFPELAGPRLWIVKVRLRVHMGVCARVCMCACVRILPCIALQSSA